MSEKSTKLSTNLASVLFSKNTPLSLRLYRKDLSSDPFEKITPQMDFQYYVAQLALGDSFYKKNILLKIYHEDDQIQTNLVNDLSQHNQSENSPFPAILTFGSDNELTKHSFPPLFYCSNKDVFFHAHCETCQSILIFNKNENSIECKYCMKLSNIKAQFHIDDTEDKLSIENLIQGFGKLQGPEANMPCINCGNHERCFNNSGNKNVKPEVLKYIYPVSVKTFSLYAFEYTPLKLTEFSNFVGGMNNNNFVSELEKQGDSTRLLALEGDLKQISTANECNIISALNKKLQLFLGICDLALKLEANNIDADSYMMMKDIGVRLQENHTSNDEKSAYPCLLPILKHSTEKIIKEKVASLHIQAVINAQNNKNTVVEVVIFDEHGNPAPIALGDVIELYFESEQIPFIVKQKNHQNTVLESLKVLDPILEQKYLSYFSQEPSQLVKYILKDDVNSPVGFGNLSHLFFKLLLSNSVLGEAEVNHALKIIFSKIRQLDNNSINETYLNTIIHTTPALSVIFRQENVLFKPEMNTGYLISDLNWLRLLLLGFKLSGVSAINPKNILTEVRDQIELILSAINQDRSTAHVDKVDDAELIRAALMGIINDSNWIDNAMTSRELKNPNGDDKDFEVDETQIYSKSENKNQEDTDETVIMPNRRSK